MSPPPRTLAFSGFHWEISDSHGEIRGPGPNVFDGGAKSVWVDSKGRLHLTIHKIGGHWTSSEAVLSEPMGYGTYRFTLARRVDALDPNVVVGLFTWDNDEEDAHRELDVEFSRWGDPLRSNGQFVIQPYDTLDNLTRFELPPLARSVHSFDWFPESAAFVCRAPSGKIYAEHIFGHGIPKIGKERAIINFWQYENKPPRDGKPVELIVEKFEFIPASPGVRRHTESLSPTG
ncbi:hypothetical protein BH11ARM2_BH11ARM2_21840 [soil metagenome]